MFYSSVDQDGYILNPWQVCFACTNMNKINRKLERQRASSSERERERERESILIIIFQAITSLVCSVVKP